MINPEWTIFQPDQADWREFLFLADQEGWRVPSQEVGLFRGAFRNCAWVAKSFGRTVGFVTAVDYRRTGWIGNLLVAPEFRHRGMGRRLFDFALEKLGARALEEVWLTASEQGRKIYRGKGFRRVDGIVRWARVGVPNGPAPGTVTTGGLDVLVEADCRHWRDQRKKMLGGIAVSSRVFRFGETVALLQDGDDEQILGPWYSPDLCPRENRQVLTAAIEAAPGGLILDVLESSPINQLLSAAGFRQQGRTDLMVRGNEQKPDLRGIVALASLGSMG